MWINLLMCQTFFHSIHLGIRNIAVVGVFSPASKEQEVQVAEIIRSVHPGMSMTLSHEVGLIGLLERENATVLNESLKPLCKRTVGAFCSALRNLGLKCPFYLTQNDGTIIRYVALAFCNLIVSCLVFLNYCGNCNGNDDEDNYYEDDDDDVILIITVIILYNFLNLFTGLLSVQSKLYICLC